MHETVEDYLRICEELDEGRWEVTKWEADFLEGILARQPTWLSEKQKEIIETLSETYLEGRGEI